MASDRDSLTLDDVRQRAEVVIPPYITVPQIARALPSGRNGRPTHAATVIRWITAGTKGPTGEVVRLRAVRLGGRWLSTREWIDEFTRSLTPTFGAESPMLTSAARNRSAERAARELDRIGI